MATRKVFRFNARHDILLLKERLSIKPNNTEGWKRIALNLNLIENPKFDVDHRACRERTERLVNLYKRDDRANLRK